MADVHACQGECILVVKSTFLDLNDGRNVRQLFRELRKAKTESDIDAMQETEVYHPGKFSDDWTDRPVVGEIKEESDIVAVLETEVSLEGRISDERTDRPVVGERTEETSEHRCPEEPSAAPEVQGAACKTTVMLRNLPLNYGREMILGLLDERGFAGCYDFVYLPCDFERRANLGYAFVNLVDADTAAKFWAVFDGFAGWSLPSAKVCRVGWSEPHQGFEAHVERYRNSPVMHASIPDEYRPVIFADGVRKPFPAPTRKLRPPGKAVRRERLGG